jgi:hypothetical protein
LLNGAGILETIPAKINNEIPLRYSFPKSTTNPHQEYRTASQSDNMVNNVQESSVPKICWDERLNKAIKP